MNPSITSGSAVRIAAQTSMRIATRNPIASTRAVFVPNAATKKIRPASTTIPIHRGMAAIGKKFAGTAAKSLTGARPTARILTVIGNIIAGLVITYMRPFKLGDRIKLNDTTGNVIEKTPLVTRIRTPKNELVTIPNSFIMSSHTVNYSASARTYGLIIHAEVSIGYDVPWRKVHSLLLKAAQATQGVAADPEPFVLETELQDWYPVYQINAYITEADQLAQIYSNLYQSIQDVFAEADVEIMSPHYMAVRDGNETTIPKSGLKPEETKEG